MARALRGSTELDDKMAREVAGLDFPAFFPPMLQEGALVVAHNDPRVRAADKLPPFIVH